MTLLLLEGAPASGVSSAADARGLTAGLSSAIAFGRTSLKNRLFGCAWRPAEHLAYLCQCILAQPSDYPVLAHG